MLDFILTDLVCGIICWRQQASPVAIHERAMLVLQTTPATLTCLFFYLYPPNTTPRDADTSGCFCSCKLRLCLLVKLHLLTRMSVVCKDIMRSASSAALYTSNHAFLHCCHTHNSSIRLVCPHVNQHNTSFHQGHVVSAALMANAPAPATTPKTQPAPAVTWPSLSM